MSGVASGARFAAAVIACALATGGASCVRRPAAASPEPPAIVKPTPAVPSPGERYLASAREALERGAQDEARERLEFILALERDTPERPEALYLLGLLLAHPGAPPGAPSRAAELIEEAAPSLSPASRRAEARLVLALLEEESRQSAEIERLRGWLRDMEADGVQLRAALDQREQELQKLKKIKEILLGKASEP